ncbi:MAG: pimeloyl-CoA dehydrogenase small subunit [Myxococcales bacterium]|nr:MAG: pimeloyl-CoA dehydrogenase small subunit [Myxococcales bacterium]
MDFELSDDQRMLVDTVANFVRRESPVSRARKLRDDAIGYSRATWQKMGELGWLGLPFGEELGGLGGGMVDVALVLEQLGLGLVPEPYLSTVVLAGGALSRAGSAEQQARWLAPAVAGERTLALAYAERDGRYDPSAVATRAERDGEGYRLHGEKLFVLGGQDADAIVVTARDGEGVSLLVVERDAPGLQVRPVTTLDGRRAAVLRFEGVHVEAAARLGAAGEALPVIEAVLDDGAAAACAEGAGLARAVLDMTTDYLRTREQFGVKIGSFQVLQHRAVDMFIETELLRSTMLLAAIKAVLLSLFGDEAYHLQRYAALPSFTRGVPTTPGA